jgi:DNA-binding beta-propeller fold protein YncE
LAVLLPAALLLWSAPGAGAASRIYWGSCFNNTVSFANLNGTGGGDLTTTGVTPSCPQGVAMDLLTGKIYWADAGQGSGTTISFANLDDTGGGANLDTTGATSPVGPVGVATDPANGKIYWGAYSSGPLSFANLDDTGGGGDLSTSGATAPNSTYGVAVDSATGKLYWANQDANTISFANLDGTGGGGDLNTTGATVRRPEGVAIDAATERSIGQTNPTTRIRSPSPTSTTRAMAGIST